MFRLGVALGLLGLFAGQVDAAQADDGLELGAIEARLFYKGSGRLSGDIIAPAEPFIAWNTVIGEGSAEEPADDLLVLVTVTAQREMFSPDAVTLWVTGEGGKQVARRRFDSILTSHEGTERMALWLNDVTCAGDLTLHATFRDSHRTAKVALHCGE